MIATGEVNTKMEIQDQSSYDLSDSLNTFIQMNLLTNFDNYSTILKSLNASHRLIVPETAMAKLKKELKRTKKILAGIVVYNNSNNLTSLLSAISCIVYQLECQNYKLLLKHPKKKIKVLDACLKYEDGLHTIELNYFPETGAKNINEFCSSADVVGIEAIWALVFNINLCVQLGVSVPGLVVPGIMIGDGYMYIYCVDNVVIIDSISLDDNLTPVMHPMF